MATQHDPSPRSGDRIEHGTHEVDGELRPYSVTIHGLSPDEARRVVSRSTPPAQSIVLFKPKRVRRLGGAKIGS